MPLIVNSNITSLNAQRHLGNNTTALNKRMERLASGSRINRAGDDAAGLQLSENLRSQIRGREKALQNVQDGINVLNIVDGAYQTLSENLQRSRELLVQAGNDTYGQPQRDAIYGELVHLFDESYRITQTTQFNGVQLLDGPIPEFILQIGSNAVDGLDDIDISSALDDGAIAAAYVLGLPLPAITNNMEAQIGIDAVDNLMGVLNERRGRLGAFVNRLEGTATNLQIAIENLSASESRIRDADVASESAELTRYQILQQSSATVLAQANQLPSLALQLLQQ